MFYTIYKITNKINNIYYIGKHQTTDLNDEYMGSGKLIKRAFKKYGKENFVKEILHIFDNEEDMNNKEKELVVLSEETYNLCEGGKGGFGYINKTKKNLYGKNGQFGYGKENLISGDLLKQKLIEKNKFEIHKLKISTSLKQKYLNTKHHWLGKKHSDETKKKISIKNSTSQKGKNNSQYGTCWITNGKENKKIHKKELDTWIGLGYYKGRS